MKNIYKKGFTLIELLVVIAIIGILSGIVLTSLNTARTKAKDARIQATMSQIRVLAETTYDGSNYNITGNNYNALANDISTQGGTNLDLDGGTGSAYAVEVKLNTGKYFCVDSTGNSGERVNSKTVNATVCPAP